MGISNGIEWLFGWLGVGQQPHESYELTESDVSAIEDAAAVYRNYGGVVVRTRPPRDSGGIDAAVSLLQTIHDVEVRLGVVNESEHHAHEIYGDGDRIAFHWVAPTADAADRFDRQVRSSYDGVTVAETDSAVPELEAGEYAAGASFGLAREFWYPFQSPLTAGVDGEELADPYADIVADAAGTDRGGGSGDDCRVLVQTVFEPARDAWSRGGPWGHDVSVTAYERRETHQEQSLSGGVRTVEPTPREQAVGRLIGEQAGARGYYVTMRVVAVASDPETASQRVRRIAAGYEAYTHPATEQGLVATPIPPANVPDLLEDVAGRDHEFSATDRLTRLNPTKFLVTAPELAGLCHLPTDAINAPAVDWANMDAGPGVPPAATQMEDVATAGAVEESDNRFQPVSAADADVNVPLDADSGSNRASEGSGTEEPETGADRSGERER
ncbi:hypothetical protein [Halorientalis regularis]|uniref:DUF8128 domain-containing protein n=1 Tax=Halorientalis regularis TaxID=660518 RepID=A0A1G7JX13_9EURY|nr:hypothetical protein [Halorientalis regularis]SDF29480.1 hypothetical protein SAMN05216218_10591 [Halorientalis regularis]